MTRLPAGAFWPLACFCVLGAFWGAWAALLPDIKAQVGASDAELGLAMLGAGAGALPAMLLTGRLWRRYGWWLLPWSALFYALATLGPVAAASPLQLAVTLLFIGAGSGALDVAMNAAVSDVESARGTRLMYGAHALFSGSVLAGSVTTGLAREWGAAPVQVLSVVAALLAAAGVGSIAAARGGAHVAAAAGAAVDGVAGHVTRRRAFALLALLCATALLIEDAVQNWSALHLERTLLAGPALGGAAPGVFAGAMFAGRALGHGLGARFSERSLVSGGALLAGLGLIAVSAAPVSIVALVGLAFAGGGIALVAPALYATAGRLAGARGRGAAIARLTFFGYMGFLVGPVLMGGMAELAGLPAAFATMAALCALLGVAGLFAFGPSAAGRAVARGVALLRTGRG